MNTRLQVEHPVTEAGRRRRSRARAAARRLRRAAAVDGRIARPARPRHRGARLRRGSRRAGSCRRRAAAALPRAADARRAGRLRVSRRATRSPVHYDPLLAKVIASAETRDAGDRAARRGAARVSRSSASATNIPFLLRILEHPRFRAGDVDTGFLDREGATLASARRRRRRPRRRRGCREADADHAPSRRRERRRGIRGGSSVGPSDDVTRIGDGVYRVEHDGRNEIVYVAGPPAIAGCSGTASLPRRRAIADGARRGSQADAARSR